MRPNFELLRDSLRNPIQAERDFEVRELHCYIVRVSHRDWRFFFLAIFVFLFSRILSASSFIDDYATVRVQIAYRFRKKLGI